ncbi:hypothetical protein [Acinetobacter chinensis]|uniref:hypothetical protein n=1 Tax=Acinetobacter chinensis TaxID=2004650 RepID=UPI0029349155|nr:hypothetical protein [Acinetobacter chinensis]WOE40716.1 hypothetical protein QSG87_12585 [Acinetobacter chinensis]
MLKNTLFQRIVMGLMLFWSKIPPETKDRIVDEILKQFDKILREFYKQYKQKQQQSSK